MFVTFHRAVCPDGFSLDFDKYLGLDQIGTTGLAAKVDHGYEALQDLNEVMGYGWNSRCWMVKETTWMRLIRGTIGYWRCGTICRTFSIVWVRFQREQL